MYNMGMKDLWTHLKETQKPIVLYGMGNGADKIISVLNTYDIKISGVFASDGFVREKTFHGFKVTDYKTAKQTFGETTAPSGLKVMYGKNNRMNDLLTTKIASKSDIWFHVKDAAGAHVVLLCEQNVPTNEDIEFAAKVAAENSSVAASGLVAVDYTKVRFVKKPTGAKPGMVIYTEQKTAFLRL